MPCVLLLVMDGSAARQCHLHAAFACEQKLVPPRPDTEQLNLVLVRIRHPKTLTRHPEPQTRDLELGGAFRKPKHEPPSAHV